MIETWVQAQRYDPANVRGTPFRGFAYQAVRGAVLESVRRRHWKAATAEPIHPKAIAFEPLPDELVARKQHQKNVAGPRRYRQLTWLRGAIDKLKPLDAFMVHHVYLNELDVTEMAERLGMEPRAVSRRLAGIVKRLIRQHREDGQRARQRRGKRGKA